jgi:type I restriction enzyme S subunit
VKSLPKRKTSRFSRLRERNKNGASREAAKNAKGILLCKLGDFIRPVDVRNSDSQLGAHDVMGINISKTFMPSVANLSQTDLSKYKIVETGQFVYSPMQVGRDECVRVALYTHDTPIIVSPAYVVFEVTDQTVLIPEFLFLWFSRPEFDRYGWFLSDGSVRSSLEFSRFCEIQLPVPPIERQRAIVALFHATEARRQLMEELDATIAKLGTVLMGGLSQ